ncbi:hypothetical protein B0H19DRAFT_1055330 [Mycena capillaripes]|nr:hypothetical protein B0H19DRAFT_1055330 [Mycena capillaripes]
MPRLTSFVEGNVSRLEARLKDKHWHKYYLKGNEAIHPKKTLRNKNVPQKNIGAQWKPSRTEAAASDPALIRGVTTLVRAILGSGTDHEFHVELSSFQSPPSAPEERHPNFKPTQNEHMLKQDRSGHGALTVLDNYDLHPSRYPEALANFEQNVTFNSPSTAFEGWTRRRAEMRMIEEDSFEKRL